MEAFEIWISGTVQGVFFRKSTEEKAEELGVKGWVKNLPDGRVQAWAEGEESAIKEFIDWCHKGPSRSDVKDLKKESRQPQQFKSFEIR